ncbi:uncharacterized protein LOC135129348 isoform X2 [Zophobas morio]|uniref:uncharacterized protein LOC135129348 isoform X2 n=1 Tax=Zophobas morio TaxID=2755281 RepID=UPI00308326C8
MSLNRRLYKWLLGPHETVSATYFKDHVREHLVEAIKLEFKKARPLPTLAMPYKMLVVLVEKSEIGNHIVDEVVDPVLKSLKSTAETMSAEWEKVLAAATHFFSLLDAKALLKHLTSSVEKKRKYSMPLLRSSHCYIPRGCTCPSPEVVDRGEPEAKATACPYTKVISIFLFTLQIMDFSKLRSTDLLASAFAQTFSALVTCLESQCHLLPLVHLLQLNKLCAKLLESIERIKSAESKQLICLVTFFRFLSTLLSIRLVPAFVEWREASSPAYTVLFLEHCNIAASIIFLTGSLLAACASDGEDITGYECGIPEETPAEVNIADSYAIAGRSWVRDLCKSLLALLRVPMWAVVHSAFRCHSDFMACDMTLVYNAETFFATAAEILWRWLLPTTSISHVETIEIVTDFLKLHRLHARCTADDLSVCEKLVCQLLTSPEQQMRLTAASRFSTLWRLSGGLQGGKDGTVLLKRAVLLMKDLIHDEDVTVQHEAHSWLALALANLPSLLHPLLEILLHPSTRRRLNEGGGPWETLVYLERRTDIAQLQYAMDSIQSLLREHPCEFMNALLTVHVSEACYLFSLYTIQLDNLNITSPTNIDSYFLLLAVPVVWIIQSEFRASSSLSLRQLNSKLRVQASHLVSSLFCALASVSCKETKSAAALLSWLTTVRETLHYCLTSTLLSNVFELQPTLLEGLKFLLIVIYMCDSSSITCTISYETSIKTAFSLQEPVRVWKYWIEHLMNCLPLMGTSSAALLTLSIQSLCRCLDSLDLLTVDPHHPVILLEGLKGFLRYCIPQEKRPDRMEKIELSGSSSGAFSLISAMNIRLYQCGNKGLAYNLDSLDVSELILVLVRCMAETLATLWNEGLSSKALWPAGLLSAVGCIKARNHHIEAPLKTLKDLVLDILNIMFYNFPEQFIASVLSLWPADNPDVSPSLKELCRASRAPTERMDTAIHMLTMFHGREAGYVVQCLQSRLERKEQPVDCSLLEFLHLYLMKCDGEALKVIWEALLTLIRRLNSSALALNSLLWQYLCFCVCVDRHNLLGDRRLLRPAQEVFYMLSMAILNDTLSCSKVSEKAHALKIFTTRFLKAIELIFPRGNKDRTYYISSILSPVFTAVRKEQLYGVRPWAQAEVVDFIASVTENLSFFDVWKKEVHDIFMAPNFFRTTEICLRLWSICIKNLTNNDTSLLEELLDQEWSVGGVNPLGLFGNLEQETGQRALMLNRVAFILFANQMDQFQHLLPHIMEKIVECMKHPNACRLHSKVLFLFRVALLRSSPASLTSWWTSFIFEMEKILVDALHFLEVGREFDDDRLSSILSCCKVLDLVSSLPVERFKLHQWVFFCSAKSSTSSPLSCFTPLLERLYLHIQASPALPESSRDYIKDKVEGDTLLDEFGRRKLLLTLRSIKHISELGPFLAFFENFTRKAEVLKCELDLDSVSAMICQEFIESSV